MNKIIGLSVIILLLLTGAARADRSDRNMLRTKWWQNPEIAADLKLNQDQIARLDELHNKLKKAWRESWAAGAPQRAAMSAVFQAEPFDPEAARAAHRAIAARIHEFEKIKFETLISIRQVLGRDKYMLLKEKYQKMNPPKPRPKTKN